MLTVDRVLLIALVLTPVLLRDQFLIDRLGVMLLFALAAVALDLIWGYGGLLSLGHAVLLGGAGYAVALLTTGRIGLLTLPAVVAVGVAALLTAGLSATIAWIGSRGRRPLGTLEFALLTLALGVIGEQIALRSQTLGGRNGLVIPGRIGAGPVGLDRGTAFYVLAALLLVLGVGICRRFLASATGTILVAGRDDPDRVELLGLDVRRARVVASGLAGVLAGLAGALVHLHSSIVTPGALGIASSTTIVLWVVLGGRGTLVGPAVGAVALQSVSVALSGALLDAWLVVVGLVLIIAVISLPGGIAGLLRVPPRQQGRQELAPPASDTIQGGADGHR
jgi:urea transport system permease protein